MIRWYDSMIAWSHQQRRKNKDVVMMREERALTFLLLEMKSWSSIRAVHGRMGVMEGVRVQEGGKNWKMITAGEEGWVREPTMPFLGKDKSSIRLWGPYCYPSVTQQIFDDVSPLIIHFIMSDTHHPLTPSYLIFPSFLNMTHTFNYYFFKKSFTLKNRKTFFEPFKKILYRYV